jgi:hypothetical protein
VDRQPTKPEEVRRAHQLSTTPRVAMTEAAVIRQMLAAGETSASIRALTGASSQAIYSAARAGDRRGRPISRSKAAALIKAGRALDIDLEAGAESDEHVVVLGDLRDALSQAYDDGIYAGGREKPRVAAGAKRRREAK